ncbi:MAG: hypothetical protein ABID40_01510 [Candidatus Bipolaricaulota bacterium]
MDPDTCILPWYVWTTDPLPVTPAFTAFGLEDETTPEGAGPGPLSPPEGMVPLTYWTDGRALACHWYWPSAQREIPRSPLFSEPVHLALTAILPVIEPEWMRVRVSVVGLTSDTIGELLRLFSDERIAAPLAHVGHGRIGLPLGFRWFRLTPELTRALPSDTDETRALAAAFAREAFDRIVFGDDAARAIRLLESIPGIRGERPDSVC